MSLINKMLQDLESRKNPQADTAQKKSVYEDLRPISRVSSSRAPSRRLMMVLALVAVVGGGAYAWTQWGDTLVASLFPAATPAHPAPTVARKTPPPKPVPAAAPVEQVVNAASPPGPQPVPAAAPGQTPATPENDQAVQAISSAVADDKAARPPIPAVAPKQAETGEKPKFAMAKESGYWTVSRGETLYGISTRTGIDLWDLSRWNALGRDHGIHTGQKLRLTPPDAAANAGMAAVTKPKTADVRPVTPTAGKPGVKPGQVAEANADTVMDKKVKPFSANEKAEVEYRLATGLVQKGRSADAENHLRLALKSDDTHTRARELLTGLMLQQGHWREAQQLLEQGIDSVPAHYPFAQLLARIYVEHGADQKALDVMEKSRRAGAEDPEYLSFLAALYQRVGRHDEAIKNYTGALALSPQEGRSWLGMGISLEAVGDWNAAGSAFQRAIESGTLEDKLLKYARQRLMIVKNK